MVEYRVLQTEEQNEEVSYTAYGIQGFVNGQPVERIPDITTNRASAEKLCTCQEKVDTKKGKITGSPVRSCTELGFCSPRQQPDGDD